MSRISIYQSKCPKCKGQLKPSKFDNNKYVCKQCNAIIDETEVKQ